MIVVQIGKVYIHKKTGKEYIPILRATISKDYAEGDILRVESLSPVLSTTDLKPGDKFVVYKAVWGSEVMYAREEENFLERWVKMV